MLPKARLLAASAVTGPLRNCRVPCALGPPGCAAGVAAEVLSGSTRAKDLRNQPAGYLTAGVAQYWVVDLHIRTLEAFCTTRSGWATQVPLIYARPHTPGLAHGSREVLGFDTMSIDTVKLLYARL